MTTELKRSFLEDATAAYAKENELPRDALLYWFYSTFFDVDFDDIPLDEIIDGTGERQLDIFKIDVDDSSQRVNIYLAQAKEANGFSANTVSLMKTGLDFIFKAKKSEYDQIVNKGFVEKIANVRERRRG